MTITSAPLAEDQEHRWIMTDLSYIEVIALCTLALALVTAIGLHVAKRHF